MAWPSSRLQDLFGIDVPLVQAPMAGANGSAMAIAVSEAGGLGSLPAAMLSPEQLAAEITATRAATSRPFNVNFFCHWQLDPDPARDEAWRARLAPYYAELGVTIEATSSSPGRGAFDDTMCEVVEATRPPVVSFHFGLPAAPLLDRVKATGAVVMSSATTVAEARLLESRGCDVIIAQGLEAGGHRGLFLDDDLNGQLPTVVLLPLVVDAVSVPVIAAGGIMDGRGIAAALALGAAGVQLGTAYLFCPEATISPAHRTALQAPDPRTTITNVITGRPARAIVNRVVRELGPLSDAVPPFPRAAVPLLPLRAAAESRGSGDFSPLWAGQGVGLGRVLSAGELTQQLVAETLACLETLA
jgi:nitronate monooxygenase